MFAYYWQKRWVVRVQDVQVKTDLGPNDAVHDEPASAAYVENFALRVFAGADNEDRNGNITKYVCMCML